MNIRFSIGALTATAVCAAVLSAFPLHPAAYAASSRTLPAAHSASSIGGTGTSWAIDKNAASSLFRSASYRQTHVHLMPTYPWMAKHAHLVGSGSTSATPSQSTVSATSSSGLPPTGCTLATDTSVGDANPSVPEAGSDGQLDSLDMSAVGFATVNNAGTPTLEAQIQVVSLTDGTGGMPATSPGQVDNWFAQWTDAASATTYYLRAQYSSGDPTTTTVFTYGTLQNAQATILHVPSGNATGAVDTANNTITIDIPLASVGAPANGVILSAPIFETDVQVGSPLYSADSLQPSISYAIGTSSAAGTCQQPHSSLPGPIPTTGASHNLVHYGGTVVHSITNHLIFWLPQAGTANGPDGKPCTEPGTSSFNYEPPSYGSGSDSNYEAILQQYFKDVSGGTSFYNLLTQYADQTKSVTNNSAAYGGSWSDPCGYTSTTAPGNPTVPGGTAANPVYDLDIQNEVLRAMKINGWHAGLDQQYYVFLGFGVATCFNGNLSNPANSCDISGAPPAFCAYHGDFIDPTSGTPVLYANMTDGGLQTAFTCYQSPIGSGTTLTHNVNGAPVSDYVADAEISITSHEQFETVNDAQVSLAQAYGPPLGWYSNPNDLADGEIGDKCAYKYGNYSTADDANITLAHGDRYIVQLEWSNWANGCSVGDNSVAPGTFGGASDVVTILKGWNLVSLPATGLGSAAALATDMTRAGQLPAKSVKAIASYHGGHWSVSIPGYTGNQMLARTDGVFVLSSASNGTWTPSGTVYTTPAKTHFGTGWNLAAATWPNPGVMTDSMFNEVESQNHACPNSGFSNQPCASTLTDIAPYGPSFDNSGNVNGGAYLEWKPSLLDNSGNQTWPMGRFDAAGTTFLTGNQVPFTNGMWVQSSTPLDWTPDGVECQHITAGMCS